jgi:anti-sigma factor RsiW
MPHPGSKPSKAQLHAFVDGELDRAQREAVRAYLASSPADAARVEAWRRQNEAIRAAFAPAESLAFPWSLPQAVGSAGVVDPKPAPFGWRAGRLSGHSWRERCFNRMTALAFAAGALLAAGAAYLADHNSAPGIVPRPAINRKGAKANDKLAAQALAALRAAGAQPALLSLPVPWQEQSSGSAILPNIVAEGFRLTGVRALPDERGQMLCLFYEHPDGGTVALCGEKSIEPGETAFRAAGGFQSAKILWRQKGANYVLIGALPEARLRSLAEAVRSQIEAFDAT